MGLRCLFGHRWQMFYESRFVDVVVPLRLFTSVLRCARCGTTRLFEAESNKREGR
jgi:hypothetical protein